MVFSWKEAIKEAEHKCKCHLKIAERNGEQPRIKQLKRRLEKFATNT